MHVMRGIGVAAIMLSLAATARADELKSGPEKRIGGPFQVTAFSGANKGKTLCYI
jgi:hypothetical protein